MNATNKDVLGVVSAALLLLARLFLVVDRDLCCRVGRFSFSCTFIHFFETDNSGNVTDSRTSLPR